ncbi:hypothetical protein [Myxosarcina sp. GI1]|uniref:hypothetical protein n=1 Tax=Myxosarcina sp. GI1 TaxID=1541065 RepID=UPI0012E09B74|nr:hypothetical protein [Myxosarcina sp. GI1]
MLSIFGVYCDSKQEQKVRNNIENLIIYVWECSSEDVKYRIGAKFGAYRNHGDTYRKNAAQKILELVNGLQYKDEDSLASELIEKLQDLRTVHFEYNNFYNEYSHAKSIASSIPNSGIPKSARKLFVKIISICYAGNGKGYKEGIDENALPYYESFINKFTIEKIKEYLKLFEDHEFVSDLEREKADRRMRNLAKILKNKTTDIHINKSLDIIISFPRKLLTKISTDSKYKNAIQFV